MAAEKKGMSLPLKLLIGIAVGIVCGLFLPESVMTIVVTLKYVLNQLIMFCVPLIVIGFIAPSITKMGSNATRMLMVAIIVAYASTVLATLMSMIAGYVLVPFLPIASSMEGLKELPGVAFQLDIPQIMPVMSALVFSVLIGLAAVWTKARTITAVLQEFQNIVLSVVKKVVIPVLPFFIALTFCGLSYDGTITKQFPAFLLAIVIVMAGHYIWMAALYGFAGVYSGRSAVEVVKHYGPAYLTAVGTMSSAATLAVALQCAHKSENLRSDMVDFGVPLFANIHLCGSVLTEVFFCMTVSQVLYGELPEFGTMALFCVLLAVIPMSVILVGAQFTVIKYIAIILSAPFLVILTGVMVGLMKWLRHDELVGLHAKNIALQEEEKRQEELEKTAGGSEEA